jgi:hypothetical protein
VDTLAKPIAYSLINTLYVNVKTGEERNITGVVGIQGGDRLLTVSSLTAYSGGMLEVNVLAKNGQQYHQSDTTTIKVYVLPETKLLKFVFKDPPRDVQSHLSNFARDVESAVEIPIALNLLETQYLTREDGTLDVTRTR